MRIFLLPLTLILLRPKIDSTDDLEEADRFLREITIDNGPNITQTDTVIKTNATANGAKSDDPEADKFIEDLKALAEQDSHTSNRTQEQKQEKIQDKPIILEDQPKAIAEKPEIIQEKPEKTQEKTSDEFDVLKKETLDNHPELFYVLKLNGSSFRVKLTVNRTWSRDMLYPSNLQYAIAESQLAKTFNQAYQDDADFLNFHMLSFNYRNNDSFYCDFILNFKTRYEHLKPFLRVFLTQNLSGLPILTDDLEVYVVEINPANFETCPSGCDVKCDKVKCPIQCCHEVKETTTVKPSDNTQWPVINIEYLNNTSLEDWGLNNSFLQDEVMNIMHELNANKSYGNGQSGSARSGIQGGSNQELQRTFSDFALPNQKSYVPYEYYQPARVNTQYQIPSLPYQAYETLNKAPMTSQFYRPEKRTEVPNSPRFERPIQHNFVPYNPRTISDLYPRSYPHGSNFQVFYPGSKRRSSVGVTHERGVSRGNIGKNYKIWYPRV